MIYLQIFLSFFKIGLFTIGGGLAALPLLHRELLGQGWVTAEEFANMVAISQCTPGPIGINMATYAGFRAASVGGALCATAGMVTPSLLIILMIARAMHAYAELVGVRRVLAALRPAALGMIASAGWFILRTAAFSRSPSGSVALEWRAALLFALLAVAYRFKRLNPVLYILAGGAIGLFIF